VVLLRRRLADLLDLAEEAVELRRGDPPRGAVGERERLDEQALDVAAGLGARGQHARAQAQLLCDARALVVEVDLGLALLAPIATFVAPPGATVIYVAATLGWTWTSAVMTHLYRVGSRGGG